MSKNRDHFSQFPERRKNRKKQKEKEEKEKTRTIGVSADTS